MKKFITLFAAASVSLSLMGTAVARMPADNKNAPRKIEQVQAKVEKKTVHLLKKINRKANLACMGKRALFRAECNHQFRKNAKVGLKVKFSRIKDCNALMGEEKAECIKKQREQAGSAASDSPSSGSSTSSTSSGGSSSSASSTSSY